MRGHGEQEDPAVREIDTGIRQMPVGLRAQACPGAVPMIAIPQREQIEAVVRPEAQAGIEFVDRIELDEQPIAGIRQFVLTRFEAGMHDTPGIES